ncbi:MAG: toll/interleukin-1 receptor domain-containing protein [Hyphomonadaceae bacterium]|nr:toll/interleukin-1 receptor domain-containing protein [Hyphomonadaceae bacterium]
MSAVFISYKRDNLQPVQHLVQGLRGAGLDVWWDQDIAPDDAWEATIERQLEAAKVVIVAWSPSAVSSENVKAEARRARNQGKLIQIFVEPCEPPLFFGERQGVDLSRWNGDASDHRFQTVVEATRAILAGRKPPQGVGYAPKKRNPLGALISVAALISGALAFIANLGGARDAICSIVPLGVICAQYVPGPDAEPQDAAAILAAERARLLAGLNGRWARGDVDPATGRARDCSQSLTIEVVTDSAGVSRVHVTADSFESRDQIESASDGIVRVSGRDGNGRLVEGRYEPNGDQLTFTSAATPTALYRCPDNGG